jgi:hypothetical protein
MLLTGPVNVLFDFVDHVPVSCGSIACVADSVADASSAAPNDSSMALDMWRGVCPLCIEVVAGTCW